MYVVFVWCFGVWGWCCISFVNFIFIYGVNMLIGFVLLVLFGFFVSFFLGRGVGDVFVIF